MNMADETIEERVLREQRKEQHDAGEKEAARTAADYSKQDMEKAKVAAGKK